MPDWYPLIRAARYAGVPPWELLEQHPKWYYRLRAAEEAEIAGSKPAEVQTLLNTKNGGGE